MGLGDVELHTLIALHHFNNPLLISNEIPLNKIQAQTGHLPYGMTERHYHLTRGVPANVRKMQDLN